MVVVCDMNWSIARSFRGAILLGENLFLAPAAIAFDE